MEKVLKNFGGRVKTKEQKRQEAEERIEKYRSLSSTKKLELIKSRPGKSQKERDRIWAQIHKQTHNA